MKPAGRISKNAKAATSERGHAYLSANLSALTEVTVYLACVALLAFLYELSWISLTRAGMCVLILLLALVLLSWIRLDSGRHPCFIFLCMLPLFQAGRLIEYAMGSPIDPYQINLLALPAFDVSANSAAIFLLVLSLSAICIYAPCSFNHAPVLLDPPLSSRKALRYLYAVFCITLPFAVAKNILLFYYASLHGGYIALFTQLDDMMASVPSSVRFVSGMMTPAFLAIFVLEVRKVPLYISTALYCIPLSIYVLIGSRGGPFAALIALWLVYSIKTRTIVKAPKKRSRLLQMVILSSLLILIATCVQNLRNAGSQNSTPFTLLAFIAQQDSTMNVTELAIEYRDRFSPYARGYFAAEIESAFGSVVAKDQSEYIKGQNFSKDATVFLNPDAYSAGFGIGGSYLGEAYVAGAIPGVICVSLLLGVGFNRLYHSCSTHFGLFVNALILPSILWMVRGEIFDWVPALVRGGFLVVIMFVGWKMYMQCSRVFAAKSEVNHRIVGGCD